MESLQENSSFPVEGEIGPESHCSRRRRRRRRTDSFSSAEKKIETTGGEEGGGSADLGVFKIHGKNRNRRIHDIF
jgi:hypothetical protein